jgi:glycosyltransferase 2 family protein
MRTFREGESARDERQQVNTQASSGGEANLMRRIIAFLISSALLVLIYRLVDFSTLIDAMRMAKRTLVAVGILTVLPLMLATAWRLCVLTGRAKVGFFEAVQLVLVASTLNLFLPSKAGDIAKAWVLVHRHGMEGKLALSISIFEKALDLTSLLLLGVIALLYVAGDNTLLWASAAVTALLFLVLLAMILPIGLAAITGRILTKFITARLVGPVERLFDTWQSVIIWYWSDRRQAVGVLLLSIAIWAGHLMQFWLFALSVSANIPILDNMAFATLGILAGLLPFTFAGIGTRDAALIHLYGAYLTPGQGAFLGVLATLRYVMPGIAGLPFLAQSIRSIKMTKVNIATSAAVERIERT